MLGDILRQFDPDQFDSIANMPYSCRMNGCLVKLAVGLRFDDRVTFEVVTVWGRIEVLGSWRKLRVTL